MTGRGIVRRLQCERGQAFVELVLILPFFLAIIVAVVWAGGTFYRYLQLADTANNAARAGAVSRFAPGAPSPCTAAGSTVTASVGSMTDCNVVDGDLMLTLEDDYPIPIPLPFWNPPPIHLKTTAAQRVE